MYHYGGNTLTLADHKRDNVKVSKKNNAGATGGGMRSIMGSELKAMAAKDLQETRIKRGLFNVTYFLNINSKSAVLVESNIFNLLNVYDVSSLVSL